MKYFPPILLAAALALGACASDQPERPAIQGIAANDPNAIIFSEHIAAQVRFLGYDQAKGYWTPVPADVQTLSNHLRAALEGAMADPASVDPWFHDNPESLAWHRRETQQILDHLHQYRRQYIGLLDPSGRKQILVRGFPAPGAIDGFDFPHWKEEIVVVSDGGYWYWYAIYDVQSEKLVRLDINGYA